MLRISSSNAILKSLEALRNLNKLERLYIENTGISQGLEYLPESIERFDYEGTKLEKELEKFGYPNSSDFVNLLVAWRKVNPDLIIARWRKESENWKKEVEQSQEELQIEREEFAKALQKAQEWRERQIKEITEQKDEEINNLKKQVSQLQVELVNLQEEKQQARIQIPPK